MDTYEGNPFTPQQLYQGISKVSYSKIRWNRLEEDCFRMKELYFVSPYISSLRTIHFQYGSSSNKFIHKITSGEINGRGTNEGNTEEVMFDEEQGLLKNVSEKKKELLDSYRWVITEKQSTTQPSFIQNDLIDGKIINDTWLEK